MGISRKYASALATNSTASSFASKIPTIVEPTNDGVINLVDDGGRCVPEKILLLPYGLGSDNDAFSMRVIGWRHVGIFAPQGVPLWVPTILVEVACTISAAVGVATAPVLNTERFADTITIVAARQPTFTDTDSGGAASRGDVRVFSPTNDLVGWLVVKLRDFEKIELTFDQTTNTPTMNALYAFLDE